MEADVVDEIDAGASVYVRTRFGDNSSRSSPPLHERDSPTKGDILHVRARRHRVRLFRVPGATRELTAAVTHERAVRRRGSVCGRQLHLDHAASACGWAARPSVSRHITYAGCPPRHRLDPLLRKRRQLLGRDFARTPDQWPGQVTQRFLADGRPVLYFDDESTDGPVHEVPDPRPRTDPPRAGQIRYDVLTGEWVTIAGHRMNRTFLPSAADCPLDPTTDPARPTEVPDNRYDVVAFANRFPSFAPLTVAHPPDLPPPPFGPLDQPAYGHSDVVVFSSDHDAAVTDLPAARMRTIIEAWVHRTAAHSADPGVAEVFIFENSGQEIGVTLSHPHGQVYAYPTVPPRSAQLLDRARRHRAATGGNLLADVLAAEQSEGTRVVLRGEHFTAYVPRAARWPVEVHLAPNRDVPDLTALEDAERAELGAVYQELLRRVNRFHPGVERVPYISAWHQAPTAEDRELGRLHLQLFSLLRAPGKLKYLAGSESGMGAWINDTTPERIAHRLREVAS